MLLRVPGLLMGLCRIERRAQLLIQNHANTLMPKRWNKSLVRARRRGLRVRAHGEHRSRRGRKRNYWSNKRSRRAKELRKLRGADFEMKQAKDWLLNKIFKVLAPEQDKALKPTRRRRRLRPV